MAPRAIKFGLILVLILGLSVSGWAKEEAASQPKKITKEKIVEGKVVGLTNNFIAINYGLDKKTSYEMALSIDKDTKVERKKSLVEIIPGDGVWIKYAEISEVSKEKIGQEERTKTRVLNKVARVIRFMSPAPKELQSVEEAAPAEQIKPEESAKE